MGRVIVVGSINLDRTIRCAALPSPGETALAESSTSGFGGKGGNQACAASSLGAPVHLVAAVGSDDGGERAMADLAAHGVRTECVEVLADHATGRATVVTDSGGENLIVVEPGANAALRPEHVSHALRDLHLGPDDVVLTSAEIPRDAVGAAAAGAAASGTVHVHNLAPYRTLDPWTLGPLVVLVANEVEARQATGEPDPAAAAQLLAAGRRAALVTSGRRGAVLATGQDLYATTPPPVAAIDSTGAGDTFCGALAAALARGLDDRTALDHAVRAGAIAVTASGARGAMQDLAAHHRLADDRQT